MDVRLASRLAAALSLTLLPGVAHALGTEELGNKPLSEANYTAWPGLAAVVNDPVRVYQYWVNGNENCYYTGNAEECNQTLANFAAATLKEHEVVLRPGPGSVKTFDRKSEFTVNWHLQIFGGIAGHMTTLERGADVWPKHPRLTIYIGGDIDLDKLAIPKNVTLVGLKELGARARRGIESDDKSVRGWSAGVIASIDPHDKENLAAVEKLLKDDDNWVRLNAAGAISMFGHPARSAIPLLKDCQERGDEQLQKRAAESIEKIEAAQPNVAEEAAHREAVAAIERFIAEKQPQREGGAEKAQP
jgi:hypothetical protein